MTKAKKKARIKAHEGYYGWCSWSAEPGENVILAEVSSQPTRKRAIAMVKAALEAGGYAIEEEG